MVITRSFCWSNIRFYFSGNGVFLSTLIHILDYHQIIELYITSKNVVNVFQYFGMCILWAWDNMVKSFKPIYHQLWCALYLLITKKGQVLESVRCMEHWSCIWEVVSAIRIAECDWVKFHGIFFCLILIIETFLSNELKLCLLVVASFLAL